MVTICNRLKSKKDMKEKIFNWGLLVLNLLGIALNIYVFNPFLLTLNLIGTALTLVMIKED